MKKSTLEAIRNYLNGDETVDLSTMREEVNAEWERLTAKSRENRKAYADAKGVAFSILSAEPKTVKEIFTAGEGRWPEGFTANKVQYALRNYWNDQVEKHENGKNPFTYSVKA